MAVQRSQRTSTFLLRTDRFDRNIEREKAGGRKIVAPFAESALASFGDTTKGNKTLRDKGSILERGCKNAVLVGENHGGGEISGFLRSVITDNAEKELVRNMGYRGRYWYIHIDLEEGVKNVDILIGQVLVAEGLDLLDGIIRANSW